MRSLALLLTALLAWASASAAAPPRTVYVAVAASMMPVMRELEPGMEKESGVRLELTPGASGKFAAQIQNGAPFDVFVSADMGFPEALADKGLTDGAPALYARGTLVLWSLAGVDVSKGLRALESDAVKKIAVADPKTAPYGRAAIAALEAAGVYEAVASKLVYGESISQVDQFIVSRAVEAGLAARSVVEAPEWAGKGRWAPVDSRLYAPIDQGVVVLKAARDPKAARAVRDHLLGRDGRRVLKRFGYALP